MDTALSETQEMLRNSVREYLRKEVSFDDIRAFEANGGYDTALWGYLQASGYLALPFSEVLGGDAGGLLDLAVLVEELCRHAVVVPFVETILSAITMQRFADQALSSNIVKGVLNGTVTLTPALLEASDRYEAPGLVVQNGTISGEKRFVDYGLNVTHHLVSALDDGLPALFLVDANRPEVTGVPLRTIARTSRSNITYAGAPVQRAGGADALAFLVRINRVFSSISCLGNAQQALDTTVDYVKQRVQFGRPIGSFQAVQHHCANMATMVEAARFLAYEAVWGFDNGEPDDVRIAVAKNWGAKTATEVTMLAHQLHGGIGVTEDYQLHFFTRRGKDAAIAWGSADETLRYLADTIDTPERKR